MATKRTRRTFLDQDRYALNAIKRARQGFAQVGRLSDAVTSSNFEDRCPMIGSTFTEAANSLDFACNQVRRAAPGWGKLAGQSPKAAKKFDAACATAKRRQDRALEQARRACEHRMRFKGG